MYFLKVPETPGRLLAMGPSFPKEHFLFPGYNGTKHRSLKGRMGKQQGKLRPKQDQNSVEKHSIYRSMSSAGAHVDPM